MDREVKAPSFCAKGGVGWSGRKTKKWKMGDGKCNMEKNITIEQYDNKISLWFWGMAES